MSLWEAFILGVVQGATEFLPVSSSGHLVITQVLLGVTLPGVLFEVALHVATLLSILIVYRQRVAGLAYGTVTGDPDARRYVLLVVVATIPAGLVGVLAKDSIEALFDTPAAPGLALLVTGTFLWTSRAAIARTTRDRPEWAAALLIGVAQACALVPGISRSGATVVAALWLGVHAREAAAFAFMMAIPAISGAAVLSIGDLGEAAGIGTGQLVVGSLAAAVVGILAIRTFVAMLARESFHLFAPYCWAVGVAFLAYLSMSG